MNRYLTPFVLSLFILITGCDPYSQDSYQEYYVVEAYMIAHALLPEVKVSTTLPIDERYTFEKAAISNATVTIQQLAADGTVQQTYAYRSQDAGIYRPVNPVPVLPKHRYQLFVGFPNGDSVQAETYVPGDLEIIVEVADSITYQAANQLEATTNASFYPGRQTYFVFSLKVTGNPGVDRLTPFYVDILDEDEDEISDFYINSSPILNEETYVKNPDGTLTIKLPWAAVAFYGENKIILNAIDDNLYDFIRSQGVQAGGGGSTLPPGQIQNIIYHVEGGIGIFGSMASDTTSIFIKRN